MLLDPLQIDGEAIVKVLGEGAGLKRWPWLLRLRRHRWKGATITTANRRPVTTCLAAAHEERLAAGLSLPCQNTFNLWVRVTRYSQGIP